MGWVPGSIKDESWAECGNLALKELPNEICFCLSRMGHFKVKVVLETLPSLDRARMTENNIHLVEIYRTLLPDHDLTLSTKDVTPRSL